MKLINILGVSNGVGITRDIELLKSILTDAGYTVETNHIYKFEPKKKYDLNIFLERFKPELFECAEKNVMIPNQEWFEKGWIPVLKSFDCVFTKTKFADSVFKQLGCKTDFISFTSDDRYMPDIQKDDLQWIHIAGKSIQKQTDIVMQTWEKNPGFPHLTVLQDPKFFKPRVCSRSLTYMANRVSEQLLKTMQNANAVHVCPSETEGFGHYIMEALSCKAIVLTTGAPPMNELVTEERGVFVSPIKSEPLRLSIKFPISTETLEQAVIKTLIMDDKKKKEIKENGRKFFLDNDLFFRKAVVDAVKKL